MKPKFEDVEREIRRLAHEHPDRTALDQYEKNGSPCCIYGHAFYNLGIPVEKLHEWDTNGEGLDASDLTDFSGVPNMESARRWVRQVQSCQDFGYTFRDSVRRTDDWLIGHG